MSKKQIYSLVPTEKTEVTITLTPQENTYFTLEGSTDKIQTFSAGQVAVKKNPKQFTLHTDGNYASAMIEVQYAVPQSKSGHDWNPPSYCHVYFQPEGTEWIWSGELITGDNISVLVAGEGFQKTEDIKLKVPTVPNPIQGGSQYQCLQDSIIFLLDKKTNGNMLFRGNEPLAPGLSNQKIDFNTLHNTLKQKYFIQTGKMDFPAMGSYVLRDIAFLGSNEDDMMLQELTSFGGNNVASQLANQAWYPTTPVKVPMSTMIGQVSNWNVEPEPTGELDTENVDFDEKMANQLSTWMNTQEKDTKGNSVPYIYYIHCASGHDRTGIASSCYLMANYEMSVSEAFILGTTINKLAIPMGGNLVRNCNDVGTTTVDAFRSRCFVIANIYNETIVSVSNKLKGVTNGALSTAAISGDPAISNIGQAYVIPSFPWSQYERSH